MNRRNLYFFCSLTLTIVVLILLITGSSLLTVALDSNNSIPLGTFITWMGMIAFPFTIYWGIKEMRKPSTILARLLSGFLKGLLVLGILWAPLSYLLAGNLSFSFSEKETFQGGQEAMRWFWRLCYTIGLGTIVVVCMYWISLLFRKKSTIKNSA